MLIFNDIPLMRPLPKTSHWLCSHGLIDAGKDGLKHEDAGKGVYTDYCLDAECVLVTAHSLDRVLKDFINGCE